MSPRDEWFNPVCFLEFYIGRGLQSRPTSWLLAWEVVRSKRRTPLGPGKDPVLPGRGRGLVFISRQDEPEAAKHMGASQSMLPKSAGNCSETPWRISQPLFFIPATQWDFSWSLSPNALMKWLSWPLIGSSLYEALTLTLADSYLLIMNLAG